MSGGKAASYNPLDALDPDSPDVGDDAATLADAIVQDEVAGGDNPARVTELRRRAHDVAAAIAELAPPARAVVVLRAYHDLDYDEIAALYDEVQLGDQVVVYWS